MNEQLVQFIWERSLYDGQALNTTCGKPVEVVQAGWIQQGQGPDLNDAMLRIDGRLWSGTVEVHKRSSEWYAHGHQSDPAYENVILHVVLDHDVPVRTASGRTLPTVELKGRIETDIDRIERLFADRSGWVPCGSHLMDVPAPIISEYLIELLKKRLSRKAAEAVSIPSQASNTLNDRLFRSLMLNFGLTENKEPMGMLASILPFTALLRYRNDSRKTEALLLGCAGFLKAPVHTGYAKELQAEFRHLKILHQLEEMDPFVWKFGRLRPSNFPTVRLALMASLLVRLEGDLTKLLSLNDIGAIRKLLAVQASSDWHIRYTLDELSPHRVKRLGRSMQDVILSNTIAPIRYALARREAVPGSVDGSIEMLQRIPAPNDRIVRGWSEVGLKAETLGDAQALTELKSTLCSARKCLTCRIGAHLASG